MTAACTDGEPDPAPSAQRLGSVEWVVGGGDDPMADDAASLLLPEGSFAVADDGAVWTVGPRLIDEDDIDDTWRLPDRLTRVDPSGAVSRVELDFIDTAHLDGAQPSDIPRVVSGPLAFGEAGVLVVVGGGTEGRSWCRTYVVDATGHIELWEPAMPEGYAVTDLLEVDGARVMVIGSTPNRHGPDTTRRFAVDAATMTVEEMPVPETNTPESSATPDTRTDTEKLTIEPQPPLVVDEAFQRVTQAEGLPVPDAGQWGEGQDAFTWSIDVDVPCFLATVPRIDGVPDGNRSQEIVDSWAIDADAWKAEHDPAAPMPMEVAVLPDLTTAEGTGPTARILTVSGVELRCDAAGKNHYVCGTSGRLDDESAREAVFYRVTVPSEGAAG